MIPVTDPTGAARDEAMPSLALALDPRQAQRALARVLGLGRDRARLLAVRVTRHKPGRRCLVEYDLEVEGAGAGPETLTLIGKVRAGRYGMAAYRLLRAFREKGFAEDSPDGICVPEPVGTVSRFRMWLQRKVAGSPATDLLAQPDGVVLARRIAEAARKVHAAGIPCDRRHSLADELRILHRSLEIVASSQPRWATRIASLLQVCDALAAAAPPPALCGIHRDFYGDQIVVAGPRLYLIDFDLYCRGDAVLDIGNFLGHVTEQSLRTLGDPGALRTLERALEDRYVELTSERLRPGIRCYAALTLVRHVYLSTLFPERRPLTASLLELCEDRLGVLAHEKLSV
jgi:hypothetical protein